MPQSRAYSGHRVELVLDGFALTHPIRSDRGRGGSSREGGEETHLLVRGRHKGQELVHVAHREPVRVELHGCLHLLGLQEVPHHPGHLPPAGPGQEGEGAQSPCAWEASGLTSQSSSDLPPGGGIAQRML